MTNSDREELEQLLYPWLELDGRANAAHAILEAGYRKVEVTDAALQRLREAVYAQTANHTYLSIEQAEAVLSAALGGDE